MLNRIAIIGNGGGGKTTLSRRLHRKLSLPLTQAEKWIIDGFGLSM